MKLADLKKIIDKASKTAGKTKNSVNVEVWLGEKELYIESIGQFGIVPDVVIHLTKDPKREK